MMYFCIELWIEEQTHRLSIDVFRPYLLKMKNVLGISFPAFVELCSVIAQKYFANPSNFGDSCDSARGMDDQAEPTSEGRKRAFTAFVEHCSNALNMPFIQSPSPRPTTATPVSLH